METPYCHKVTKSRSHKNINKVSQNGTQFKNYLYLCPQEIKTDIEYGSSNRQRLQGQHV